MKKYFLIFIFLLITPIFVDAGVSKPYVVDEKPQVLFSDSIATSTYYGLENYTQNYVNGFAHFTFTYTHHKCCSASYPPIAYITDVDPRTTQDVTPKGPLEIYFLRENLFPSDWYAYDVQFDATGYNVVVTRGGVEEVINVHMDVPDLVPTDWVAIANLLLDNPIDSMAFTPVPIFEIQPPKRIDPVIIIPGIMGSAYKNDELVIDPILHTYDDLIATLDENGYTPGVDLFTFPYEWRDSNVLSANLLKDKIATVKQICNCDKVDLVAHSMGGLVAREYIQSSQYGDDVDQLIFLGTPHKGSQESYLRWEAGEFGKSIFDRLAKSFFTIEAIKNGYSNLFTYIHERPISSVQELLPTFDYIKDGDTQVTRTYPSNYPRNLFLEALNLPSNIDNLLNSGIKIINIVGNTGSQNTLNIIRVDQGSNPLWIHGKPNGYDLDTGDRGLENGSGDGTVTTFGSTLDSSINNEEWNGIDHLSLPRETSPRIFTLLTDNLPAHIIHTGTIENILKIILLSPIDVVITAPDGKKMGKNFATGQEYNEIPGAFYSGFETEEEYITIPNPLDGEYKVEIQGTGNGGYTILSSLISDATSTTSSVMGTTTVNQITDFKLELDQESQTPVEIKVEDRLAPAIQISSPQNKNYLRSQKINIVATTTDADSGIASFVLKINNQILNPGDTFDLFFSKLGQTALFATSTDNAGNFATSSVKFKVTANVESTISDITRAFDLKWIKDKVTKDALIKSVNQFNPTIPPPSSKPQIIKSINKEVIAQNIKTELKNYLLKKLITQQAYDLIKEDVDWIANI